MPRLKSKPKTRRAYGDGRVFLRDKTYWVDLYLDGRRIRRTAGTEDRAEALEVLAQLRRERSRGELVVITDQPAKGTVGDVLDEYLKRRSSLADGTRKVYETEVKNHLKPVFGLLPVEKVTTDMISDYRNERAKAIVTTWNAPDGQAPRTQRKITVSTINREVGLLRAAMRDYAKRYPSKLATTPYFPMESERGNARQGFVTEADFVNKIYPEMPRHLKAFSACAFYGGGRKGEWLGLNWEQVDFSQMLIRFLKTKNKDQREVPIIEGLMLDSLLEALRLRNAQSDWDQEAVFCFDGKRMKTVGKAWAKACKRAGFEGLLRHDMRRSASKNMRDRGVSQTVRMRILGHKTTSMDIRYCLTDLGDIHDARERLSRKKPGSEPSLPEPIRQVK